MTMDRETKDAFSDLGTKIDDLKTTVQEVVKFQDVHKERHRSIERSIEHHGEVIYPMEKEVQAMKIRCDQVQKNKKTPTSQIKTYAWRVFATVTSTAILGVGYWLLFVYKHVSGE